MSVLLRDSEDGVSLLVKIVARNSGNKHVRFFELYSSIFTFNKRNIVEV